MNLFAQIIGVILLAGIGAAVWWKVGNGIYKRAVRVSSGESPYFTQNNLVIRGYLALGLTTTVAIMLAVDCLLKLP